MHYYQDANKNWYYTESEFGSGCYDCVYVSTGEMSMFLLVRFWLMRCRLQWMRGGVLLQVMMK